MSNTEQYIGAGIMYANGRDVGNVSALEISIDQETKSRPNYRGGGGNAASTERVKGVRLKATLDNFSNDNLALALRGVVDVQSTTAITGESQNAVLNGLTETDFMIDKSKTVTVKEGATPIGVEHYQVTAAGILLTGGVTDGAAITIDYTPRAANALQALVDSGKEVRVVFDGLNDHNGRPSVVRIHRWKPAPTSGLGLISDDYATFELEGEVLADTSRPIGKSQFFERVDASA